MIPFFAGAMVDILCKDFICLNDAGIAAKDIYLLAKDDLREYLKKSSHTRRLKKLNIEEDIKFCLQVDICKAIPVLNGEKLIKLTYLKSRLYLTFYFYNLNFFATLLL